MLFCYLFCWVLGFLAIWIGFFVLLSRSILFYCVVFTWFSRLFFFPSFILYLSLRFLVFWWCRTAYDIRICTFTYSNSNDSIKFNFILTFTNRQKHQCRLFSGHSANVNTEHINYAMARMWFYVFDITSEREREKSGHSTFNNSVCPTEQHKHWWKNHLFC